MLFYLKLMALTIFICTKCILR